VSKLFSVDTVINCIRNAVFNQSITIFIDRGIKQIKFKFIIGLGLSTFIRLHG